ncbi:unnamed protein product [Malus baccata var. baccata]
MANLAKLDYATLDITGKNYLTWYLTVEDPLTLWNALRSRYNHQTMVPRARYEWTHLRIQDFKSVAEYNYVLFRITSQLKLSVDIITEENLLEKTFSTFHASNVLLQQQYKARGFTEYNQLISVLLVAEQNNKLLMKNHHSRPTGSAPFPEVNAASLEMNVISSGGDNYKRGCGHKQGR